METKRLLLEEIDTIEFAIAKRLRKNPSLLEVPKSKLATLAQHELAHLRNQYNTNSERIRSLQLDGGKTDLQAQLVEFDENLARIKRKSHDGVAEDLNRLYAPYSAAPSTDTKRLRSKTKGNEKTLVKRRAMLSQAATHIDLDRIFRPAEHYGRYLDLSEVYSLTTIDTYVHFLHRLKERHVRDENLDNSASIVYLGALKDYLEDFYKRAYPLQDIPKQEDSERTPDFTEHDDGTVFCIPCNKTFAKRTVYEGHVAGKKHRQKSNADPQTEQKTLQTEKRVLQFLGLLQSVLEATLSHQESRHTMGAREVMIEATAVASEDEYTSVHDESSSEEEQGDDDYEEDFIKDLPLGTDGQPMPFWLYKLQGLHKTYSCEICGNAGYKGRVEFSKHFIGAKHQYGLKCLGVDDASIPMFKDIVSIDEAVQLWRRIKKDRAIEEGKMEGIVEVEDSEGNVMSERDYNDLKRQGLL